MINSMIKFYLIACDICRGVSMSSNAASFKFAPLRLASCRSLPDRSQFLKKKRKKHVYMLKQGQNVKN